MFPPRFRNTETCDFVLPMYEKETLEGVSLDSEAQILRFHIVLMSTHALLTVHATPRTREPRTKDDMIRKACYSRGPMSQVTPYCP